MIAEVDCTHFATREVLEALIALLLSIEPCLEDVSDIGLDLFSMPTAGAHRFWAVVNKFFALK
jgi:hypothetical protein